MTKQTKIYSKPESDVAILKTIDIITESLPLPKDKDDNKGEWDPQNTCEW